MFDRFVKWVKKLYTKLCLLLSAGIDHVKVWYAWIEQKGLELWQVIKRWYNNKK